MGGLLFRRSKEIDKFLVFDIIVFCFQDDEDILLHPVIICP